MVAPSSELRVLLIEDNPGDVELVRLYLRERMGDTVELVCADSLATGRVEAERCDPDVVLLDLGLPDGDGVEVVREVRRWETTAPIIVLTADERPGAAMEALKRDAQDFLAKDRLDAEELERSVRYAHVRHLWQRQYRHQLAVSPDGVLIMDEDDQVCFVSDSAVALLGAHPESAYDLPPALKLRDSSPRDARLMDGRTVEVRSTPTEWHGEPARLVILREITDRRRAEDELSALTEELQRANRRLEDLVGTDPLTEVLNRRGMEGALVREVERMRRTGDQLIAILIDCDDFKAINDNFGHAVGDAVLRSLSENVRSSLRGGDHVARVGGDEFLVLLPSTSLAEGMSVAEKLRRAIKDTTIQGLTSNLQPSASLAVGIVERDTISIEQVLGVVNAALKRSKATGKDRVSPQDTMTGFAPEDFDATTVHLRIATQTIRRIADESIVGVEALLRGPPGHLEDPTDLFRAAYEQNVTTMLDLRAMRACLGVLATEPRALAHHVNLLPSTILRADMDELRRVILESGAGAPVCLEISEQQFLGDPSNLSTPLAALRRDGVRIAIDDVGFGRSSVEALLTLEPDVVKVDRRCVRSISDDSGGLRQFERLMAMLATTGADIVVEGVQSESELKTLREIGVEYAQGFYWDVPSITVGTRASA